MKLLTEVSLPEYPFTLNHRAPVLMMGSCFTENIGRLMERYLFPVHINPLGVTYNPLSVKKGLEALLHKETYEARELEHYNDLWFSFDHSGRFSSGDQAKALEQINDSIARAKKVLQDTEILVLTWGTSWVYHLRTSGEVVNNCHKIPAGEFTRTRLSPKEIIHAYDPLLEELFQMNSRLKILHTVSPVRHWKDGAHGNQLSKASLLLAGDALQEKFPDRFFYFPSYEIVMDELRDYRFYAEDMMHTSDQATQYIWERFSQTLVSEDSLRITRELEPLMKMVEHRPLKQEGEAYKNMLRQTEERLIKLKTKYPFLDWDKL